MPGIEESVTIRYVTHTQLVKLEEKKTRQYVSGHGNEALFSEKSLGWFAFFKGSYEALHIGSSKPNWKLGDRVKITFEKVEDAKPQPTSVE